MASAIPDSAFSRCRFLPWVGSQYASTPSELGCKILVVGESHYRGDDDVADEKQFTRLCVRDWIDREDGSRFWPAVEETVLGLKPGVTLRKRFWESVAFMNFSQEFADALGVEPAAEVMAASQLPFIDVMQALAPQLILCFSCLSWPYLPNAKEETTRVNGVEVSHCEYSLPNGKRATAMRLPHPRGGLSPRWWHPVVTAAMAAVRRNQSGIGEHRGRTDAGA